MILNQKIEARSMIVIYTDTLHQRYMVLKVFPNSNEGMASDDPKGARTPFQDVSNCQSQNGVRSPFQDISNIQSLVKYIIIQQTLQIK